MYEQVHTPFNLALSKMVVEKKDASKIEHIMSTRFMMLQETYFTVYVITQSIPLKKFVVENMFFISFCFVYEDIPFIVCFCAVLSLNFVLCIVSANVIYGLIVCFFMFLFSLNLFFI